MLQGPGDGPDPRGEPGRFPRKGPMEATKGPGEKPTEGPRPTPEPRTKPLNSASPLESATLDCVLDHDLIK